MRPRDLLPLHALALATALLAPACKPEQEDTTDTAATDTAATDTAATDTAATEPTTTDTADTDTSAATDPGDTETTGADACIPPDPAATGVFSIDFGSWPILDGEQQTIEVAADCAVQTATNTAGQVDVALLCSAGDQVDVAIAVAVTAPADFAIDLSDGLQVRLDAYWQGEGHHVGSGQWFVLRAAGDDTVLLAGVDLDSNFGVNEALGTLSVTHVDGACEPPCGDNCFDSDSDVVERLAFAFAHSEGPSLELLDQTRGELLALGRRYDIVLSQAHRFFCLNCWDQYRWILGSVPA